jgi:putative PIN family toxin of toxin-antitoxin system
VRALFDANVLISGLLSRAGAPAHLLAKWLEGEFELVVTERLLQELEVTLARPKLRCHLDQAEISEFLELLRGLTEWVEDPEARPGVTSRDPKDDYLIAAAASAHATLVTGDTDLLELEGSIPVVSPQDFLDSLDVRERL